MLKRLFMGLFAAVIVATGFAAPAMAAEAPTDPTAIVLAKINAYREAAGASVLATQDPRLVEIAQNWADELQRDPSQAMVHNPNVWAMMAPATKGGETVSMYYPAEQVASKWYQSGSHRPILLSDNWNAVGIGYVHDEVTGYYWIVADFAYYPPATVANPPAQSAPPTLSVDDALHPTATWADTNGQGHELTLYTADGTQVWQDFVSSPATSYNFRNMTLDRGQSYYATVAAYNGNGVAAASDPSATVAIPALAPAEVTTAYILRQDEHTMFTYWWASKNTNGAAATRYTLRLYQDGALYATDDVDAAAGLHHNYIDLPAGFTYKVGVIVHNSIGASPEVISPVGSYMPVIPSQKTYTPDAGVPSAPSSNVTPSQQTTNVAQQDSAATQVVIPSTPTVAPQVPATTVASPTAPTVVPTNNVAPSIPSARPSTAPVVRNPGTNATPQPVTQKPVTNKQTSVSKPRVTLTKMAHRKLRISWGKSIAAKSAGVKWYTVRVQQGKWVHTYRVAATKLATVIRVPSTQKVVKVNVSVIKQVGKHVTSTTKHVGGKR